MKHYLLLFFFLLVFGCSDNESNQSKHETTAKDISIPTVSPTEIGINNSILNDLTKKIEGQYYPNIHSVLIAKDGKLFYEEYFEGEDQNYGENLGIRVFSDTSLHDIRSITKSVVSALVGIAIDKGLIKNTQQSIADFFPEYIFEGAKAHWSIEHFLIMSTGLDWNEDVPYNATENDENRMTGSDDPIAYVMNKPIVKEPGEEWNYSGGATQVLAEIVERVSKMSIDQFANENLFEQLSIEGYEWNKYSKWGGADKFSAAAGLRLKPRDLLKLGLLYRNKGAWNGEQIISEFWIEESLKKKIEFPSTAWDGNDAYGYQFWIWPDKVMDRDINIIAAVGNGDQRIYWDFENDVIIVTTAGNYNQWDAIPNNSEKMYKEHIYPAIFNLKEDNSR